MRGLSRTAAALLFAGVLHALGGQTPSDLKEINPGMNVFVLYRDMRTYGERELLYKKARYTWG